MADYDTSKWEEVPDAPAPAAAATASFDTSKWEEVPSSATGTSSGPLTAERANKEAKEVEGANPALQTPLEGDPVQQALAVATGGASIPAAIAGPQVEKHLAPVIGQEPASLVGAGVSGAMLPIPGIGAAARAGYGVASQAGQDIAGEFTDNPWVKAAAGFAAPILGGAATKGAVGAKAIMGGAEEAATEATEENAKQSAAATEKAGDVADEARQKTVAQNEVAAKAKTQLEQKTAEELAPAAKTAAVEQATGRTAQQAQAEGTMGIGPDRIARNEQFRSDILDPLKNYRQDWANRRNEALGPLKDEPIEAPEVVQAMQDEQTQAGAAGIRSPKIKSLYKRAATVVGQPQEVEIFGGNLTHDDIAQMEPEKQQFYQNLMEDGKLSAKPKGSDLLTLQSDANAVARSSKGLERKQAMAVVRGVDRTFENIDAPTEELKKLNAEYRDHRTNFPYEFEDKVSNAARPIDAAHPIFDQPQRALDLYDLGTSDQQNALKRLYADAVHTEGTKFIKPDHAQFLQKAFSGTVLEKPDSWVTLPDKEVATSDVLNSSPEVAESFSKKMDAAMAKEADKYSTKDPEQAAIRAGIEHLMGDETPMPLDPHQAAMQAISEGRLAQGSNAGNAGLKSRAMRYGAVSGGLAAIGRFSPGIGGLAALSGAQLMRNAVQSGFQWSLKQSPKMAERFYQAMSEPSLATSQGILARGIAAATIESTTQKNQSEPQQ